MDDFAGSLSLMYPDTLPLPGYYLSRDKGRSWEYLAGETDETQQARADAIKPDTRLMAGVRVARGTGDGGIEAGPVIVVLPESA